MCQNRRVVKSSRTATFVTILNGKHEMNVFIYMIKFRDVTSGKICLGCGKNDGSGSGTGDRHISCFTSQDSHPPPLK